MKDILSFELVNDLIDEGLDLIGFIAGDLSLTDNERIASIEIHLEELKKMQSERAVMQESLNTEL